MDDQLEEEALVIAGASAFLGATTIFLKYYERKEVETEIEMSQMPRQPRVNRDIDRENYISGVLLWNTVNCLSKLRDKESGFGWDDNLKVITASPTVYNTYTEDVVRGSSANSFDDVEIHSHGNMTNLEEKDDGGSEFMKDNDEQSTSSAPLESRKGRKRTRNDDLKLQNISAQMGEVALALQKISKSKLDVDFLYQEVMKTEGFEEEFLGSACDHLVDRENLAKGFLAKSEKLRRIWLEKFKENN